MIDTLIFAQLTGIPLSVQGVIILSAQNILTNVATFDSFIPFNHRF
jgi:hypothetical protein